MSALDDFLDLCDADPDFDSGEEGDDDPFERLTKSTQNDNSREVELETANAKGFQDLFGSPAQIGLGRKSDVGKPSNQGMGRKTPVVTKQHFGITSQFTPKQDDSVVVHDPYTRLRLFKNSVQLYFDEVQTLDLSLKERNLTIPYIHLSKVAAVKDKGQFWTSGVLVKKAGGVRQSAKGNDYAIWEISDLDSADAVTLFLFGSSSSSDSLKLVPVGSLIDVVNPSPMHENQNGVAKTKLSVSLPSQIRHIATARDFGFCGSKRKDGKDCMNPVNKFKCDVCIHHASSELRKLNGGKKGSKWEKKGFTDFEKAQFAARMQSKDNESAGIITTVFGKPNRKSVPSNFFSSTSTSPVARNSSGTLGKSPVYINSTAKSGTAKKPVRMELQDPTNTLRKNSTSLGNHSSISFSKDTSPFLASFPTEETTRKKRELNLDPLRTKHLSERDRVLLERLDKKKTSSDLPAMLTDPNPGSQNFLQYMSNNQKKQELLHGSSGQMGTTPPLPGPIVMTRETLMNMHKALSFVKKSGPIEKKDPNAVVKKRKFSVELEIDGPDPPSKSSVLGSMSEQSSSNPGRAPNKYNSASSSKSANGSLDMNSEEFQRILNAKSAHSSIAEDNQQEEYFTNLERKEAIENKLLSTFSITTTAVMCRECNYKALSQSDLCKGKNHSVRVIKALKRFFKCKECGNRTMSLARLPERRKY